MDSTASSRSVISKACLRLIIGAILLGLGILQPLASMAESQAPWPVRMRARIALVNELDYRLRSAVAPSACRKVTPALGAEFDHISNYAAKDRTAIAQLLGLHDRPQAIAIAPASPAANAGLAVGDEILLIDGEAPARLPADTGLTFSDVVHDRIVAHLSLGLVKLSVRRNGEVRELSIAPAFLCTGHANLSTGRAVTSHEGGDEILVTAGMVDFTRSKDELALVMGHEFAHAFLGHDKAKSLSQRRDMERTADLVGAAIARCAGYDVAAAVSFWDRFGAHDKLSFLRLPTHDKPSARKQRLLEFVHGKQAPCPLAHL